MIKKLQEKNLKDEIKENFLINDKIQNQNILLIIGSEKINCNLKEALAKAKESNLDLVEFKKGDDFSICKLINFDDFLYHKLKSVKQKKQLDNHKILKLRATIEERDLLRKIKQINEFLDYKCTVEIKIIQSKRRILDGKREIYVPLQERCVIIYNKLQSLDYDVKLNKDKISFSISYKK
jgi:translation initiation factor IF-3